MRASTVRAILVLIGTVLAGCSDSPEQPTYVPDCPPEELRRSNWLRYPDELRTPRSIERMIVTCTGPGTSYSSIYVVEPQFDPSVLERKPGGKTPPRAVVARVIGGRASPEQRAVLELGAAGSTVRVDYPSSRKVDPVTHDIIFYTVRNTSTCPRLTD